MLPPHEKLVARLVQAGDLPQHWRASFEQVERHLFLPDRITDPDGVTVDRVRDEDRWLTLAYDDIPVTTRPDDDAEHPTRSAPQPSVLADMLRRLDVLPGMRALEVGTGTGYTSALLSHLLGDDAVTTVEVDAELAEQARIRLMSAGFTTLVVTGDGAQGWPARAPFDRVISTAAVRRVPYHWVAQICPGGRILTPWGNAFHNGVLADLQVGPHGTAHGHFAGDVALVRARDQRVPRRVVETHVRPQEQAFTATRTRLHPYAPIGDFEARFAIGLRMPTVLHRVEFAEAAESPAGASTGSAGGGGQRFTVYLVDPGTDSWASWHIDPDHRTGQHEVRQHGPRSLFDELEAGYRWWWEIGRPDHTRFGLTVSADHQQVWLDNEANTVAPYPTA